MNYWLDLFTGITWEEFQRAGAKISGFREHHRKRASKIRPGDIFLCYLTGVKRWVGLLEVTGELFQDTAQIWAEEVFPIRFPTKSIVMLKPEHGVPMDELKGKLSFFPADATPGSWSGQSVVHQQNTKNPTATLSPQLFVLRKRIRYLAQSIQRNSSDPAIYTSSTNKSTTKKLKR
jgi:hypothetical protein